MTEEEDSIEQAAVARRERLNALKAAKELFDTPDGDSVQNDSKAEEADDKDEEGDLGFHGTSVIDHQWCEGSTLESKAPDVKFRNYVPQDKQLQEGKLAPPVPSKFEDPVAAAPAEKVEDPFLNIAPKKPNWDLKRDVQKKLDKLERRTQKAIYKLMLEKQNQAAEENGGD